MKKQVDDGLPEICRRSKALYSPPHPINPRYRVAHLNFAAARFSVIHVTFSRSRRRQSPIKRIVVAGRNVAGMVQGPEFTARPPATAVAALSTGPQLI
jgi:hypothetical protein